MNRKKENRIVVIGGGLMGSSAAWELALAGHDVLLIEQQAEHYENGSSYGEARVTRSLGIKDDIFTYIKERSVKETQLLMSFLDLPMERIYRTSPVTYLYEQSSTDPACLVTDEDYIVAMSSDEALLKLGMHVKDEIVIREFKPFSGILNPSELIHCLHMGIRKKGGTILYNHEVEHIARVKDHYELRIRHTQDLSVREIGIEKLVVCCGPYNGSLLNEIAPYFNDLIQLKRLYLGFFKPDKNWYNSLSDTQLTAIEEGFPVARFDQDIFYAMIERIDEDGLPVFKVGGHNRRFDLECPAWNETMPNDEIDWSMEQLEQYFVRLGFEGTPVFQCVNTYACIYSMTDNEVPYVTPLLRQDHSSDHSCIVIAGLSGIGAKGSLCYGKIAADLMSGKSEKDQMYIKTRDAMGSERLLYDLLEKGLM